MNFVIDMTTRFCDMNRIKYDQPVRGAGMVCQGATGRYCVVLVGGPEWIADNPQTEMVSWDEAAKRIEAEGWWLE
jgi:hypothetical protein